MTWLEGIDVGTRGAGATVADALALRPELAGLFDEYLSQIAAPTTVRPVLADLCRLRIAQLLGDTAEFARRDPAATEAGLTERMIADLARYPTSPLFTPHERTCLNYAEQYVIDVHSITDADAAAVKQGMTDAEFVGFTVALGMFEGTTRFRLILGVS